MKELNHFCLFLAMLICSLQYSIGIDAPDNVTVSNEGSTDSLKVTWIPPADATEQEVTWSPPDSNGSSGFNLDGMATEYNITDLTPGTLYNVTVIAQNAANDTFASDAQGTTKPLPVSNLMESGATNESISASWTKPDGVVDQYLVSCSSGTVDPISPIMDDDTTTTYNASCVGLSTAGAEYTITVTSQSGSEVSDPSTIPITALPNSVDLIEDDATVDSVSAEWMKPAGEVTGYEISCDEWDAVPSSIDSTGNGPFSASCANLPTPGDVYSMSVTSLSNGQRSHVATISLRALPSPVSNLMEQGATTDSVSANWTKPAGVVSSYNITCSDGSTETIAEDNDNSTHMVTCDGLQTAGADYNITVIAISGTKASAPATVNITAYPNSVVLRAGNITTRQITVLWDDPYGVEDSFIVDCASNGTTDITLYPGNAINGTFEATCDVLMAGALFSITVTSISGDKQSPVTETFTAATPEQVTIVTTSSSTTSITVGWNAPSSADGFYVNCSDGNPSLSSPLPGSATEVTCNGVTSGGNHSVSIVTLENNGRSPATVFYVVAVPERVTLTEESDMVNTTTITASWDNATGVFDYYEVSCSNGTASPARVNPSDDLIASCVNLSTPGDDYDISVTTVSNGLYSETDTITITALPNAVTLAEGPSNNTAISATWTIEGVVDTFTITCSNGTASPSSMPVSSSPTTETFRAYCTGLPTPGLEYTISVVAISNNKLGALSSVGVHASPSGVALEEGPSTTTSVNATWMDPDGDVERYDITCSRGEASPQTITDTSQQSYSASCVNLPTPGDTYIMTVYSFVDSGMTSSSASINLTALPAMVADLMELRATNDSVSASWTKPPGPGVVTSYNITCPVGPTQTLPEDNGGSTYMVTCDGLPTAGADYKITVIAASGSKASAPATVNITAYPNSVVLRAGEITTRNITVLWDDPDGIEDSFIVDCADDGSDDITLYPGNATDGTFQATCDVPMAGAPYNITVTSMSGDKESPFIGNFIAATPSVVTIVGMSSNTTSITVSWNASSSADDYEVDCSEGSPSTFSLPGSATAATCDEVTPGGNHSVSIVTVENNGRSPATVTYVVAVPGAVNLTEESGDVTTSSITASWDNATGVFDYYVVSCSNGTASPDRVNPSDELTASCVNLSTPGDDYDISVTTVSNDLYSETDTITITALPEAVELVESGSNTDFISASWRVPGSVVDTFNITCSAGTASQSSIPVDSSQAGELLNASCIDLPRSGEEYTLSVVAISKEKQSAVSEILIYALPLGVVLEEGPSTLTTVSARWMRQNDTVESYRIMCDKGDASPSTIEDTTLESYSASCVNLREPGGTYKMTVFSEVGTNTSSNSTTASSFRHIYLVAVPESVGSISVANYTTTTVDVEWQLKDCPTCVYNHFILTFEPDSQDPIRVNYNSSVTQYSSPVSGLTQGRSYNFTVVSVSGVDVEGATPKTSEEQSVEQRTVPATPYGLNIIPAQRNLSLTWSYEGDADNFAITVMPSEGTAVFNGDLLNPAGEVTDLTPGTEYNVSVVTISGNERSEPQTEGTRTETDKPSPVQNPMAYVVDKNTIRLQYESPASPNGIIESYRISYIGTRRDNLQDHEFTYDYGPVLTVTFEDLYPGYSYIFTIIAVNDGDFESDPVSTEAVTTPEEVPPPVAEDYQYQNNTVVPEKSTTGFTVELPRDLFSHNNGELINFSVIITTIANDADVQSTGRTYNERSDGAYVTIIGIPYPYPPSFDSSRRRRATEPIATVVIGDGTCSGSSSEYCNGALSHNTRYYYAFRAYNSMGSTTSDTFGPVDTERDNTGIAVGVSMSLLAIIFVIAVGAFVTMRRRKRNNSPRPSGEGNINQGFIPPGDDQEMRRVKRKPGSSMYRKSHSKPVLLTNFEDHYRRMKADSDFKFTEEYDEIRQVGKGQPVVAALEMNNRAKNRFTNILPYEHSRVKLAALADEPESDYINANYMPGYGGPREFIACQGPLPGTVDDMWRMIWEKNTSIVVMLTQLVEMGKIKCHQYWPENYNPVTYGTIEVTMQAVQQFDHWVIREFTIVKGDDIRKLTQYHFMSWPDHGVPNQTSFMLDFVRTVREAIQKVNSEYPTVVHCSAGVGRTGTYIALDRLMQMMQEHDFVDIFGIICEMRMQRNLMVQTEKQYIFIHECVMDLLRREDGDTGESIYVNFNANGYNGDVNKTLLDQAV